MKQPRTIAEAKSHDGMLQLISTQNMAFVKGNKHFSEKQLAKLNSNVIVVNDNFIVNLYVVLTKWIPATYNQKVFFL